MEEKKSLLIDFFNKQKEKITSFIEATISGLNKDKIDKNDRQIDKKKLKKSLAGFMIFSILAMGFTGYKVNEVRTRAFDLYIGEEKIGAIRSEKCLNDTITELEKDLSKEYDLDMVVSKDIRLEESHVKNKDITSNDDLKNLIKKNADILVSGTALLIDNKEIGVLSCNDDAEKVVNTIKESYYDGDSDSRKLEEIHLLEDIKYEKKEVHFSDLISEEELIDYIKNGGEDIKTHIIEVGENFWTLALMYDTSMEKIEEANPDKDTLKLRPGDEVKLVMPKPLITVETLEMVEYAESIDFEVEVEKDSSMYTNQKKVKVEGSKGEKKVLAREKKHNGKLIDKEVVEEELVKEAVTQVVVQGTKEVPKTAATGAFLMPTRGRISSSYGRRWGRMHYGLDIAAASGTAIKAADGGTVSFSGYKGSYGNMVEINHGNGYKTRYAHCSKLLVKAGQKVYKGQHIANVGNTGRSTGPHLHFEVLKNGTNQNPSNFVR